MISILILTKNEEQDLPSCLESVKWSDDIHVYDSMSTDNTVSIAQQYGATVTQRGYEETNIAFGGDEAAHRNWGLKNISFKHKWVLQLDADEQSTPELQNEIEYILSNSTCSAYRIRRRDFLMDQWLKYSQVSPFYLRLFKPEKIHYERLINPVSKVTGTTCQLDSYFDHYPFSKGMSHWFSKHNDYSTLEAKQITNNRKVNTKVSLRLALTAKDFNERRFHQKEIFYRLPGRVLIKFFLLYVIKRGFMDGKAGLTYATLQSLYEYMIVLKTREMSKNNWKNI